MDNKYMIFFSQLVGNPLCMPYSGNNNVNTAASRIDACCSQQLTGKFSCKIFTKGDFDVTLNE